MTTTIEIADSDPRWPDLYEAEKHVILSVINGLIGPVEHVGSTSVPGLGAKPIIDIMVAIPDIEDAHRTYRPLESIGYHYLPEYEMYIPERRFFRKINDLGQITHHLHMVEETTDFWDDHILFREYLKTHPTTARNYEAMKRDLAALHADRTAFTDAKTPFIQGVLVRARNWREAGYRDP
jgi:GrpB-like predicted nucleotidyltransferase (UPF0157 family)